MTAAITCNYCNQEKPTSDFIYRIQQRKGKTYSFYIKCCRECRKQRRVEYFRAYRQTHKAESAEYRKTHEVELAEYQKAYYQTHKVEWANKNRQYRQTHRKERTRYAQQYRKTHKSGGVEYRRKYYRNNKLEILNKQHKYKQQIKSDVLTHYGNGNCACVRCGYNDIRGLSIDHIDGNGAKHRYNIGIGTHFDEWLKRNAFPLGYQTLCMNCQFIKRTQNKEYTKQK